MGDADRNRLPNNDALRLPALYALLVCSVLLSLRTL